MMVGALVGLNSFDEDLALIAKVMAAVSFGTSLLCWNIADTLKG